MAASYRFTARGRVQGVYFRQSTREQAQRLQLQGWVRNCEDGSVSGVASGDAEALQQLRVWLQQGPPAACVEQLDWTPCEAPDASGFSVLR